MDTPYAKLIEREVRQRCLLEERARRDAEVLSLKEALESQLQVRLMAEQRIQELVMENMKIPLLQEKLARLKLKIFQTADSRASMGMLARAEAMKREIFTAWHIVFLNEALAESYRTRPRPNMREYQQESEVIREQGENLLVQHWNVMHDQLSVAAGRHLDLDSYQDGRAPPRPADDPVAQMIADRMQVPVTRNPGRQPSYFGAQGMPAAALAELKRQQREKEEASCLEVMIPNEEAGH